MYSQVLFCTVSGDIFAKEDGQLRAQLGLQDSLAPKDAYLQRLLTAIMPWIAHPASILRAAAADSEAELLDICR